MRLLVTQNKPKKCWVGMRRIEAPNKDYPERTDVEYMRAYSHEVPEVGDDTAKLIQHAQKPLKREFIIDMLARYVAVHKRMNVDGDKRQLLFADYANILNGLPEYAIMLAIIDLIEKDTSVWFPPCAKIKELAESYVIVYPEKLEGEEKMK